MDRRNASQINRNASKINTMDLYTNPALRANSKAAAAACCCNMMPLCSFHINCSPNFGEESMTSEYPCNAEKLNFSAATTFGARLRSWKRVLGGEMDQRKRLPSHLECTIF